MNNKTLPIILALLTIMLVLMFFVQKGIVQENYVAVVGNEKLSESEFKFYLFLQEQAFVQQGGEDIWETQFDENSAAEDIAKERALLSASKIKITCFKAPYFSVVLDEQGKTLAKNEAEQFKKSIKEKYDITIEQLGVSEESLLKIMEQSALYKKVFNKITDNFEISNNDFENYLKTQSENTDTATLRENYMTEKKEEIFDIQYEKWSNEYKINKNDIALRDINISGFVKE